eukprot:548573-Rhodomonas_salina.1
MEGWDAENMLPTTVLFLSQPEPPTIAELHPRSHHEWFRTHFGFAHTLEVVPFVSHAAGKKSFLLCASTNVGTHDMMNTS